MTTISLITTCRGRLHQLKQTLPRMLDLGLDQVIVVDYSCPAGTREWVAEHFPQVDLVCVDGKTEFSISSARNLGAAAAQSDWLAFVDADILVSPEWGDWMRSSLEPGGFYRCEHVDGLRNPESFGTSICMRSDFEAAGQYDELMIGWGPEDFDLYRRHHVRGLEDRPFPAHCVEPISHSDASRAGYAPMKTKGQKLTLCICYTEAKVALIDALDRHDWLTQEEQQQLMEDVCQKLQDWFAQGAETPLSIRSTIKRSKILRPGTLEIDSEIAVITRVTPDFVTAGEICGFLEVPLPTD